MSCQAQVEIIESRFLVLKKCFDLETAREAAQLAPERPVEVDHLLPHQVGDVHVKTPDESQNMDILYESKQVPTCQDHNSFLYSSQSPL